MARGLVAFRTHEWDDCIATVARRLYARRGDWDFAVLADETRATLDTAPYRKVSHTEDFSDLGLPRSGDPRELWYNSDYSFYRLLDEPYDYFCISEYDVFANADVAAILRVAVDDRLDVLTSGVEPAGPRWVHTRTATGAYAVPHRSFNPFIVLSRAALEHLLKQRQILAQRWRAGGFALWPYFEAFVGSEIALAKHLRCRDLAELVSLARYSWQPPYSLAAAEQLTEDQLIHPVHDGQRFVQARLNCDKHPERFLGPNSRLRHDLAPILPELVVPEVFQAIARRPTPWLRWRDRFGRFRSRYLNPRGNLACGRPVLRSDPAALENPWWAVDLGGDTLIVRLTVRLRVEKGAEDLMLVVRAAPAQQPLRTCCRIAVSALRGTTTLHLDFPTVARTVMLRIEGRARLTATRCRVFGHKVLQPGA